MARSRYLITNSKCFSSVSVAGLSTDPRMFRFTAETIREATWSPSVSFGRRKPPKVSPRRLLLASGKIHSAVI